MLHIQKPQQDITVQLEQGKILPLVFRLTTVSYTHLDYQIATNFIAYNGLNIGEGFTEFERYDMVEKELSDNNGILNENDAISLLAKVGVQDGEVDKLQWSVPVSYTHLDVYKRQQ